MGGKTGTTTSKVSIPPEVMKRYNAVNTRAEQVASKPFQPYQGAFVAGITPTQQAGIEGTTEYAQSAQPYFQAATGQLGQAQGQGQQAIQQAFGSLGQGVDVGQQYAQAATRGIGAALDTAQPYQQGATAAAMAGSQQLTPENINIQGYMNPYTQAVADTTFQALRQQQQQEMAGQTANAIKSGAFGGDRAGLVAANLARQQQLGTAQAMSPIYQQGYSQALGTAMTGAQSNRAALQNLASQLQGIGQQGYGQQMGAAQQLAGLGQQQYGQGLGAAQQLGALGQQQYGMGAGTAQQLAALGTGAQAAGLQGAQAQLGAGTLEQQTQQADLTARYQQFLQERGYDFQVAQFLANIAMGTGALSGSTTTTQQPMPFFSDRRVKHDVKEIGKTHDGMPIYSFKYNGDEQTNIGLMAQDVEKRRPDAVYDMGGVKGVDYKQATESAERPEKYAGGLVPSSQGGSVFQPGAYNRGGYSSGGLLTDPNDIQALLQQQQAGFGPFGEGGIYGKSQHETPFMTAKGIVPQGRLHTPKLLQAGAPPRLPESGAQQALSAFDTAVGMKGRYDTAKKAAKSLFGETEQQIEDRTRQGQTGTDRKNLSGPDIVPDKPAEEEKGILDYIGSFFKADGGGVMPRSHYAIGGATANPSLPYDEDDKSPYKYFPTEILDTEKPELQKPGQAPSPTSQTGIGAGDIASLAMKFLLPFADGGIVPRTGYQEGGSPDLDHYLDAIAQIESSRNPRAIGPETKKGDRAYGMYQVMGNNIPSWSEEALGRRLTPQEFLADENAQRTVARHHFGKALNKYGTPEDAASVWFSGRPMAKAGNASDILGTTVPAYINKFRSALGKEDLPLQNATPVSGSVAPSGEESSGIMPKVRSYLEENQDLLVPFGAGLKGMFQSKSPFLGAAIGEGVGTGLEALGASREQMARTDQMRALADQTRAETAVKSFHQTPYGNFMWVKDPTTGAVTLVTSIEFRRNKDKYQLAFAPPPTKQQADEARARSGEEGDGLALPGGETTPPTGTPTPPTGGEPTPPAGKDELLTVAPPGTLYDNASKGAARNAEMQVSEAQSAGGPNALLPYEVGEKYKKETDAAAKAALDNQLFVNEYTKNLAKAVKLKGFQAAGFGFNNRAAIVGMLDTALRAVGAGGVSTADDVQQIQSKVEALRGTLMSTQAGQESYMALKMLADANANPSMDPKAFSELAAMMMVQDRRNIYRANHAQQWGADSNQVYYGAAQDFERLYNTGEMMRQQRALADMIRNTPDAFQEMMSGLRSPQEINETMKRIYGVDNMAVFFVGGAQ